MLAICWSVLLTAGNVTPEEALQQATQFLNGRVNTGNRRAPVTTQQLTMAKQVAGLYVFNVTNDNGFVIVSNDDCAESILGYADEGSFDPDNIPENMKAWLQGYADEIAWAKQHHIQKSTQAANRRAGGVKTTILPLLKTQWYQKKPYNASAPYYGIDEDHYVYSTTGTEGGITWEKCATGCAATAMAQVMNYHQWPQSATTVIPSYKWENKDDNLPALPATTFDWANMINSYAGAGSYSSEQATAIAYLMRYCGQALQMNYGPESGASSHLVCDALKNYFDYNSTATYLSRSFYSYDNWIEILYHELSQNRPVFYGGTSSGGGHAFVCDGYQNEDYFHINWGWGGLSDGFFKLSALDPDEQGVGGSSSTDGYHFGQEAIVGIQKPDDTGNVLTPATTNFNLTVNSISIDKSTVAIGNPVKVTIYISNSGTDDYDGDIWLAAEGAGMLTGCDFIIPKGESKNCIINYTPSGTLGTLSIQAYKPTSDGFYSPISMDKSVSLTVTAGGGGGGSLPTTDNIDLAVELTSIGTSNAGKTEMYDKDLNATITISNPSLSYNYSGTFYLYLYGGGYKRSRYGPINIPAGGSIKWEYTLEKPGVGSNYYFTFTQQKASSQTSEKNLGATFIPCEGITSYTADGTKNVVKATASYTAPAEALVVDISNTSSVTSVTPNSKPNCLYIYKGSKPSGLDGKNVIKFDGTATYTADNITLTDGADFYSPVNFTAENIEFTYNNDRWADGTNGWNTIILPFDVTSVTANGTPIDWFKSSSDTGKQFWLKEFVSDDVGTVNFGFTSSMKANTPYIIALPGTSTKWDDTHSLKGKTIKFVGMNAEIPNSAQAVITCSNYRFVGETKAVSTENIYCINAAGNKFELKATGGSKAFRPFFKNGTYDRTSSSLPAYLTIGMEGILTGIQQIENVRSKKDNVYYDLNGRRVLYPKKGLYILNGKKVIMK